MQAQEFNFQYHITYSDLETDVEGEVRFKDIHEGQMFVYKDFMNEVYIKIDSFKPSDYSPAYNCCLIYPYYPQALGYISEDTKVIPVKMISISA